MKRECGRNGYRNMFEDNIQRLKGHQKNYRKEKKSTKKFYLFSLRSMQLKPQILAKNILLKIYFISVSNKLILIMQKLKKQYCLVKNHMVRKVSLNVLLDIKVIFHCVKSIQIRSYFWSVFSCTGTEYGDLLRKSPNSVQIQENMGQK